MNKISVGLIIASFAMIGIIFIPSTRAVSYSNGTLLKSPKHTSVYYIENNKRRAFVNAQIYYTWFSNFNSVKTITVEQMEAIELGFPMPIKEGKKMLKFPLNPKVYVVEPGEIIKHIPDEETAAYLYGAGWNKEIIELPEIYYLFYTKSTALESKKVEYLAQQVIKNTPAPAPSSLKPVPKVVPNDDINGCHYNFSKCGSGQVCIKNQCVTTGDFLPTNGSLSENNCEKDEVYVGGKCEKAGLNLAFHYQKVDKAGFEKLIDDAVAGFVESAELGNCKEKIRVHKVHGLCLTPGDDVGAYFEKNYKTSHPMLIRPVDGGDEKCSYTNSGYASYGTYVDNSAGILSHEFAHDLGLLDQYCYYPPASTPNPVNFEEGACKPAEGWFTDYCNVIRSGAIGGYTEGTEIESIQCKGNINKYGVPGIMGDGSGGEILSSPERHFTDFEIKLIKEKMGC